MARERYLLEDTEDTIHTDPIVPTTGKEKRQNWWFYHKVHLIVGIISAALLVSLVMSIVNRENPDYNISLMTSYTVPNALVQDIRANIEEFAEDRNGDGETIVSVTLYEFPLTQENEYSAGMLQASFVKFAADATDGTSVIFIYDDDSYGYLGQNDMSGFFGPFDGTDNDYYLWRDVPGLSNMHLDEYSQEEGVSVENTLTILGRLKVAVRTTGGTAFEDEEKLAYHDDCVTLMKRLMANDKVTTAAAAE